MASAIPSSAPVIAAEDSKLDQTGTIEVEQYQISLLYSGNIGGGKLHFQEQTYEFSIGGLGIGGVGASKITAQGEIYNLRDIGDFEGAYGQARYGYVFEKKSKGELLMENANGVVIRMAAKRKGLALSMGADAIYIRMK
jgi:hypothetical protein